MRLITLGFLFVVGTASGSADCDKRFCTPIFWKELSRSIYKERGYQWKKLNKLEPVVWQIQKLFEGSVWDMQKHASELLMSLAGGRNDPMSFLRPAYIHPTAVPDKDLIELKEITLDFLSPENKGQDGPHYNAVDMITKAMSNGVVERHMSETVRAFLSMWERDIKAEGASNIYKAIKKYVECLFPAGYTRGDFENIWKIVEEYLSTIRELEKRGNYSLEALEDVNPTRFQQIQEIKKYLCGEKAADSVRTTLNKMLTENQENIRREISALFDAASVVMRLGNGDYPATEAYLTSIFYIQGEKLEGEMKRTSVVRQLERLVQFFSTFISNIIPEYGLEENLMFVATLPLYSEDLPGMLADLHPLPDCVNTDNLPEIKLLGRILKPEDYVIFRLIQPYVFLKYLGFV